MTVARSPSRFVRLGTSILGILIALAGCQTVEVRDDLLNPPVPAAMLPPGEKCKISLPMYRIEPPDVINIEMPKLVPLPPYRAEVFDVLQIRATGTMSDQPIDNYYIIEAEGVINLGPAYGQVRVVGMTVDEIKKAVGEKLSLILKQPEVSVQLARVSGTQPVTGQYLVGPDGTVNLRQYGLVHVTGMTVTEARLALQKHLSQFLDSPELSVEVQAYNSKVYYIITQGAGLGDNVRRFPITGNETVLDAISNVNGMSQMSSTTLWIARPAPGNFGCEQILPVDWGAITAGASTGTNYQVLPGDRIFIDSDKLVTTSNLLSKIISPFERVAGFMGLTGSTVRSYQTFGRNFNRGTNGNTPTGQ